jgi:putative ABC transport system permease protein
LEFAITLFLISGVVLGYEGDRELTKIDRAFDTSDLLTLWITLPPQRYPTPADRMSFYRQLEDRIRSGDAIASVSAATALPIGGGSPRQFVIEGREPLAGQNSPIAITIGIGSQYLQTLGLGIVRGRALADVDGTPGHEGAVVNQRFVDRYFPQSDPIGARMQLRSEGTPEASPWITIVGVSPTVRQRPVPEPDPVIYLATSLVAPPTTAWIVRSKVDRSSIANSIRQQVASLDADLPIYRVMTMDEAIGTTGWNGRLSNMMIRVIAIIALMMAVAGLYTVTANATAQRRQEIGVAASLNPARRAIRLNPVAALRGE